MRLRRTLQSAALGVVATLATLMLAEIALRVTGAAPERGGVFSVTEQEFDRIPGILSPNQQAEFGRNRALRHVVTIDSLGYRGRPVARSKPAEELRIFFAGDSFAFGDYVADDESMPAQLEAALNGQCGRPVRVINAGLGGSTITEHSEMIERGLILDPDLVILQFSENDVIDLAGVPMWEELRQNRMTKGRLPLSLIYPLVRNTALWNIARRARSAMIERRIQQEATGSSDRAGGMGRDEEVVARLRAEYQDRLVRLAASLADEEVPFVMTAMPSHLSVYDLRESDQLEWLGGLLEEAEISSLSYFDALRGDGRDEKELYLLPHDGHSSAEGYRVAMLALMEHLMSDPDVAPLCPEWSRQ